MKREYAVTYPKEAALQYLERGWYPIPLCWPDHVGHCACGQGYEHAGREGKVPLLYGYTGIRAAPEDIEEWWTRWPEANVGILLEPSGLLVLDFDGDEAVEEARDRGYPVTPEVETGNGMHLYYQIPVGFPHVRLTGCGESKGIDVLTKGFAVAPPSQHRHGHVYRWRCRGELGFPPAWTKELLPQPSWRVGASEISKRKTHYQHYSPNETNPDILREALARLDSEDYSLWYRVGMCLKTWDDAGNGNGRGFQYWDEWSRSNPKYPGTRKLEWKWNTFTKRGLNLATLYEWAKAEGWDHPGVVSPHEGRRKKGTWYTA